MSKKRSKLFDNSSPEAESKRQIKKLALKKMNGATTRERFANFFLNRNGYYSWKEMMINWLLIISLILGIVSSIFGAVNWRQFSLATLAMNPLFITIVSSLGFFFFFLIQKFICRKHRINCFLNNGISNKYVFWKDDKTNPKNKNRHGTFE